MKRPLTSIVCISLLIYINYPKQKCTLNTYRINILLYDLNLNIQCFEKKHAIILLKFCPFLLQIALSVLPVFVLNSKGYIFLCPWAPSFTCDSEEEPGLFIRSRHSFSHSLLPSFLPSCRTQRTRPATIRTRKRHSNLPKCFQRIHPIFGAW